MTPTHIVNNSSQGTMEKIPRTIWRVGRDAGEQRWREETGKTRALTGPQHLHRNNSDTTTL